MRYIKKLAVLITAIMMICGMSLSASAAISPVKSPTRTDITAAAVNVNYTGADHKPVIVVKDGTTTLVEGTDYTVAYGTYVNSGDYTVTVTGIGLYSGTVDCKYTINGVDTGKYYAKQKKVKASEVKKAAKKVKIVAKKNKNDEGAVTFEVSNKTKKALKKYVKVSKKGVVTLKKGAKKGTYKIIVKKAGYLKYNPVKKVIKIRVK